MRPAATRLESTTHSARALQSVMKKTLQPVILLVTVASSLTGCVTAGAERAGDTAQSVLTGELEAATPSAGAVGRANTGSSATVALGGRRERVRDAVDNYLRAVLDSDVERAVAWFADPVNTAEGNARLRSVEELTNHHRTAVGTYDMAFLRLELERETGVPIVRSAAEFRRQSPTGFAAVQQGDWVVDLPFVIRSPYTSVARYLPSRLVIRFVGSTAKVIALSGLQPLRV